MLSSSKSIMNIGRHMTTYFKETSALKVFQSSCYYKVDFKINEESSVKEAITRFTVFNIGCLAVTNSQNKVVGVCSKRDFVTKVSSLDKNASETKVKDICTYRPNVLVAKENDSLQSCMNKMLVKDIRHLLLVDSKTDECTGMISIKDLIKAVMKDKNEVSTRLSDFSIGKGAFFGSE